MHEFRHGKAATTVASGLVSTAAYLAMLLQQQALD